MYLVHLIRTDYKNRRSLIELWREPDSPYETEQFLGERWISYLVLQLSKDKFQEYIRGLLAEEATEESEPNEND